DDAVESDRLEPVEPPARRRHVAGTRRQAKPLTDALELAPPLLERALPDRFAVPQQDVERNELRRDLSRELLDSRLGRMEPHLHRVEVERAVACDHDLAVE